jgi:two-component system response regulator PilR (NtrC family)
MFEDALRNARYNKTRATELLGISFRSFRYKLKKFGIE